MTWPGPLEIAANAFLLASVYAARRNSVHVWWTGLVAVALFAVVFFGAKLYADVVLQVFFAGTSVYGWWAWLHGGQGGTELPVTALKPAQRALAVVGVVVASGTIGWAFATFTDAALPFADSFILGGSVTAQLLMMRRKLEHWWIWIVVDVVAVGVYALKALYLTAGVYAVLLALCVQGILEWRRIHAEQRAAPGVVLQAT